MRIGLCNVRGCPIRYASFAHPTHNSSFMSDKIISTPDTSVHVVPILTAEIFRPVALAMQRTHNSANSVARFVFYCRHTIPSTSPTRPNNTPVIFYLYRFQLSPAIPTMVLAQCSPRCSLVVRTCAVGAPVIQQARRMVCHVY